MYTLKHIALSEFDKPNQTLQDLYQIFSETLNSTLSYTAFHRYYFQCKPHYMNISFLMDGDKTIGFMCVTFYRQILDGSTHTICRAAIGIREQARGGCLPSWQLCRKFIDYKVSHPFEKLYIVGYIANPIVYAMICRHSGYVYPKENLRIPASIGRLKEGILGLHGLKEKENEAFILRIHFQVAMSPKDEERIYASKDRYVRYYLKKNPDFQKQMGMLTIVPVTWNNIVVSAMRGLVEKPVKKMIRKNEMVKKLCQALVWLFNASRWRSRPVAGS